MQMRSSPGSCALTLANFMARMQLASTRYCARHIGDHCVCHGHAAKLRGALEVVCLFGKAGWGWGRRGCCVCLAFMRPARLEREHYVRGDGDC